MTNNLSDRFKKTPAAMLTAALILALSPSLAQASPVLISADADKPSSFKPGLKLRLGTSARPLLGASLVGRHLPSDGSWLALDVVPRLQLTEGFGVELGVNLMNPMADKWGLATTRFALTPAAAFDFGQFYTRVGLPIMMSDTTRFGLQAAAGVKVPKGFYIPEGVYIGVTGDLFVQDLLAGVGVEVGVPFDMFLTRER